MNSEKREMEYVKVVITYIPLGESITQRETQYFASIGGVDKETIEGWFSRHRKIKPGSDYDIQMISITKREFEGH